MYLNASAKAIAAGNLDHTVKVEGINELEILSQSFNQMARQLQQSFTALENANYEIAAADKALYQAKQPSSRSMLYLKANAANNKPTSPLESGS